MNEFKNILNNFFKDYGFLIALAFAFIIVIVLIIIFVILAKNKKRCLPSTNKKCLNINVTNYDNYINYLGGIENIINIDNKGHRLFIKLKDYNLIKIEELKNLHISSIVKMSNKAIIVNELDNNDKIKDYIQSKLN